MLTYKVVLDERRPKPDGKYPLIFRITHNRNTSNYASGIAIHKEQWDKEKSLVNSSCPNFKELNKNLTSKFLNVQKLLLQMEDEGGFSFESFKERLNEKPKQKVSSITFLKYAEQLISEMKEVKRTGNAIVYQTAVNRLINFTNDKSLTFKNIDFILLDKFKHQLIKDGVRPNTIGNYFRSIRAIYNKAIKAKLVDRSLYPFTEISIRTEKTAKRAISSDALTVLSKLNLKAHSPEWHARNYLLLSFSLIGVSFTDLAYLKSTDVHKGRIIFQRRKTHKAYNIKFSIIATEILKAYKSDRKYILPVLPPGIEEDTISCKKIIQQWIKTTNKYLKSIGKRCGIMNLTTYVARHTWATTAKKLGYSNELIAEALGHEYGNRITNIYLDNFDQKIIDAMNDKVIISVISCPLQLKSRYRYTLLSGFDINKYHGQRLRFV